MKSKINLFEIIQKHNDTLKTSNGKLIPKDKNIFFITPLIIGIVIITWAGAPSEKLLNLFTLCLSVFVGLFLNLLVLLLSFSKSTDQTKDLANRKELVKQTFYNVNYTIIISLICLGILFLANYDFIPGDYQIKPINIKGYCSPKISINKVISNILYFVFYTLFTHLTLTLLMIIKRIYKLFNAEIE
ncbi:hypothetical protein [Formosa sp. A9]|uniref:hypothetical protein n=1 Tax=Formosa sp. A9 TaxID=3442641 RepID=UPI003EBF67F9